MIKVQSLKRTIIAQFTVILLPLVALLLFHTGLDTRRASELADIVHLHGLAQRAQEQYRAFAQGTGDALETLRISEATLSALWESRHALDEIGRRSHTGALVAAAKDFAQMAEALEADPGIGTLHALQERIAQGRITALETQRAYDRKLDDHMQGAIDESVAARQRVILVTLVALLVTIGFVARMIHHLSRPLEMAVAIADRIAEGGDVDEKHFNLQIDVGNLIHSLGRMYHNLRAYKSEAQAHRRGLEEKIQQLADSQSSLAEAQHLAQMGNWSWDLSLSQVSWSDEAYRILGMAPGDCEACWKNFEDLVDIGEQATLRKNLRRLMAAPGRSETLVHITTPDGLYRVIQMQTSSCAGADGRVTRLYGTLQDITERKQNEERLHYLAMYDNLTGLPNRQLFNEQLELAVARAQRADSTLAVMFIDLDRFKRINDTLGHATGDMLLKEVASRLGGCVRASDYVAHDTAGPEMPGGPVARLAGDEFTVTLDALRDPRDAGRVAQRILDEMARPFLLNGEEVVVTTSIGIALFPQDGAQAGMLLKNADAAMYQAKQQGKNTYQFFAGAMNSATVERLKMESELRHALERNELLLHYQPKIDVQSGRITGVEALMRWQHPERGLVPPGVFIPVAEETGLIVAMGEWVLEEACRQKKAWRDAGLPGIDIAINLASPSFRKPDLVERVAAVLQQYGVPPAELCLEATESILMRDADVTMATLNRLRDLGVKLSVDDFGTGYSSLSYLRRFPINQLKIDRSFVKDITVCADDAAIITAIVSLARTLKLEVVAEGVETLEQAHRLAEQGCRMMQGFYFARPLPVAQLMPLLADASANRTRMITPPPRAEDALAA